jgi:large subunit ribosomal protein L31
MKKDIHPKDYRKVLFIDNSSGAQFLIASTAHTKETAKAKADGKEYPVFNIETSSASHPFYTGNDKIMDTAGRIDRFKAKQAKATKKVTKK